MDYLKIIRKVERDRKVQGAATALDWLSAWRELAELTGGIASDDSRFQPVMEALDACDVAFLANDWPAFQRAAAAVRQAVKGAL